MKSLIDQLVRDRSKIWGASRELQIDSYMTGRQGIHVYVSGNKITIELTDGNSVWFGEIPLPRDYRK
jgi:hypothetical protein